MNLPKQQIGLIGVIFSSLVFAFPVVAQMSPRTPENINPTPGNQIENDELSPTERSRMCAERMNSTVRGQNNPIPNNQNNLNQNTNQPASITQTLPSGSVSEPPAVRDGRFPPPSQAEMEQICANEMMQQNRRAIE